MFDTIATWTLFGFSLFPMPTTWQGAALQIALAIPASYAIISCLEHFIHKRMMHSKGLPSPIYKVLPYLTWILDEHAHWHHNVFYKKFDFEPDPKGKEQNIIIGLPETISMGLSMSPIIVPFAIFVSPIGAVVFCAVGYLHNFTWGKIHRQMHVPEQNSWFKDTALFHFLARHHYLHHEFQGKNLNVVMPFADWVFGTVATPRLGHLREMMRLGYLKPRTRRAGARVRHIQVAAREENRARALAA